MNRINPAGGGAIDRAQAGTEAERAATEQAAPATNPTPASDAVRISPRAETVARLVGKIRELPEARQERVNEIRQQIQAGTYRQPAAEEIADAILRDEA